jgi:hypothetical protein
MNQPAFKRISKSFKIGNHRYSGEVIVSPDALYLIPKEAPNKVAMIIGAGVVVAIITIAGGGAIVGGVAGALVGLVVGMFSEKRPKPPSLPTSLVSQLDESIRRHPEWPNEKTETAEQRYVVVVPRSEGTALEHPKFSNLLNVKLEKTPLSMQYLMGQGGEVRDYLVASGWPVVWRNEKLAITPGQDASGFLVGQ